MLRRESERESHGQLGQLPLMCAVGCGSRCAVWTECLRDNRWSAYTNEPFACSAERRARPGRETVLAMVTKCRLTRYSPRRHRFMQSSFGASAGGQRIVGKYCSHEAMDFLTRGGVHYSHRVRSRPVRSPARVSRSSSRQSARHRHPRVRPYRLRVAGRSARPPRRWWASVSRCPGPGSSEREPPRWTRFSGRTLLTSQMAPELLSVQVTVEALTGEADFDIESFSAKMADGREIPSRRR